MSGRVIRWSAVGKHGLLFAVVGPPCGAAIVMASAAYDAVGRSAPALGWTVWTLSLFALSVPLSYLFGLVPAALAGAMAAFIPRLRPLFYIVAVGVIGGLVAPVAITAVNGGEGLALGIQAAPGTGALQVFAACGALGGLACGWLTRRWRPAIGPVAT